jgi:hypothetical protein
MTAFRNVILLLQFCILFNGYSQDNKKVAQSPDKVIKEQLYPDVKFFTTITYGRNYRNVEVLKKLLTTF